MSDILEVARSGRLARIALNRPEKRNALSAGLCLELVRALQDAADDPSVGAILLTGNGSSFCSGMDLSEIGVAPSDTINQAHEQLFTIGARLMKPIVAGIHGPALAGGTGLAANCHVVVASESATFGLTEIRIGLWPFLVYRAISAAIGERRTLELALTGRIVGGAEAKEIGFVHEISAEPKERALAIAESLAAWSPTAIRAGMGFAQEVRGRAWTDAGEIARLVRNEIFESVDFEEGIRAFREKRKPIWPSLKRVDD